MLMVSISSTSTNATDHEAAFSLISFARASRAFASSFFESSIPVMRVPGFRMTAAAETGPASGAHSGLIDARDGILPLIPQKRFKAQHLAKPLPFGPVFKAALFNRCEDRPRSRARVRAQDFLEACLKRPAFDDVALP